jgi:hypothetical protein
MTPANTQTPIASFPWEPESTKTGDLAITNVGEYLMKALKTERGVHTETLLTAIGALAGFAAQNAALNALACPQADPKSPARSFAIANTKSGERFFFGDAINGYLFPEAGSVLPLAAVIAGAAVTAGVAPADLPNYQEMAAHIASVVGTPEFGKLRAPPGVAPQMQPVAALNKLWLEVRDILAKPPMKPLFGSAEPPLQEIHWPILLSIVASNYIAMTKGALHPRISAALIMESAIITSKVDPDSIEAGKWRIDSKVGERAVTRPRP